jgi:chromosome condensin MukBEF ATPase and DNA-binding subunit MukB
MTNIPNYERELGGVQARLENLETEMAAMHKDVRDIRDVVVSVQGGWKTLAILASFSAAAGALLVKFISWLDFLPR